VTNWCIVRIALLSVVPLVLAPGVWCQNVVVLEKTTLTSQFLAGHVQLGANESGLHGVRVEVCDSKWRKVLASTITDDDGMFSFPSQRKGLHHLRLSLPGANTLLVKVKLTTESPARLSLSLTPAT